MERARSMYGSSYISSGWMLIISNHLVRAVTLSDDEATRFNMSTLPVKGGHATVFGFNHNIHCIVRYH